MKHGLCMMPLHHPSKGMARTIKQGVEPIIQAELFMAYVVPALKNL